MISWQARLLILAGKGLLKPIMKMRGIEKLNDDEIRRLHNRLEKFSERVKIPEKANIVEENISGVPCDWVDWGVPATLEPAQRKVIVYYHGSAFLVLSPKSYRMFTWRLAKQSGCTVLVPGYRKAPDHQHPAGLDDAFAIYQALLERGYSPSNIILSGDSAGGNLT
ncbi:MAG: alpha/beta hydrolase, partial [Pseudomonadales bacterium]|nr:alpha/beta hydrolase [Pseudomonadales bacterium]